MASTTELRWAIDGLEEGMARVEEDGKGVFTVPRYLLPPDVREGQIVRVISSVNPGNSTVVITVTIDEQATAKALAKSKATTESAMAASRKRDSGGDVAL